MNMWCASCQKHLFADPRRGSVCPVCADIQVRAAEARVAEFWADVTGGAA